MTARAVTRGYRTGRSRMAHRHIGTEASKVAAAVTCITLSRRRNMRRWLAKDRRTVVAG